MLYKCWDMIRQVFPNSNILCGQTDALAIEVTLDTADEYISKLKSLSHVFDFSNVDDPELYSLENKNKPGLMKLVNHHITEFISLKPGAYSYSTLCTQCKREYSQHCLVCATTGAQKASGVHQSITRNLTHYKYQDFLRDEIGQAFCHVQTKTKDGQVVLEKITRRGFSALNVHRYELPDGTSLPLGHFKIPEYENNVEREIFKLGEPMEIDDSTVSF